MKTALIQLNATSNKERSIRRTVDFVERAARQRAKFILLPEVFSVRALPDLRIGLGPIAEGVPGPSTAPLAVIAKKYRTVILAGSICERVSGGFKVFNTSVLIGADGRVTAKYRKMHLFDALVGKIKIEESNSFRAGRKPVLAAIGPWRAGLSICYDLRFPELYQNYARAGADILCVPSAFTKMTGCAHWEALLRARAIENLCYVLAPNQVGKDARGVASYGNSMVVDPWGRVVARASGSKEEIIYVRLKRDLVEESRRKLLIFGRGSADKKNPSKHKERQ